MKFMFTLLILVAVFQQTVSYPKPATSFTNTKESLLSPTMKSCISSIKENLIECKASRQLYEFATFLAISYRFNLNTDASSCLLLQHKLYDYFVSLNFTHEQLSRGFQITETCINEIEVKLKP